MSRSKLSEIELLEMIEEYVNHNKTCIELSKKYHLAPATIARTLKKNGVTIRNGGGCPRTYTINENYFDVIDTEEKAYFLGLLYADGCNYEDRGTIIISLQEEDIDSLISLRDKIGSNCKLSTLKQPMSHHKVQKRLCLHSQHLSQQLSKLGCISKKSLTLSFPTEEQVPKTLLRHFIRGYFDGDGCISYWYQKYNPNIISFNASIVATLNFCNSLAEYIETQINIDYIIRSATKNQSITSAFKLSRKESIYKFMDWLYKDATIFMKRKYDKYQTILSLVYNQSQIKKPRKPPEEYVRKSKNL